MARFELLTDAGQIIGARQKQLSGAFSLDGREQPHIFVGQGTDAARAVGDDVVGFALGDDGVVFGADDFVAEAQRTAAQFGDMGADN